MTKWPPTPPSDLKRMLASDHALADRDTLEHWWQVVRCWFDRHGIHIRLEWLPDLARAVAEAEQGSATQTHQPRWAVVCNWLESRDIPVPDSLRPMQ